MKINFKSHYLILFIFLVSASCKKDNSMGKIPLLNAGNNMDVTRSILSSPAYKTTTLYSDFIEDADVTLYCDLSNSMINNKLNIDYSPVIQGSVKEDTKCSNLMGGQGYIGDVKLEFLDKNNTMLNTKIERKDKLNSLNSIYGQNTTFSFTSKDNSIIFKSSMYIPQKLNVSSDNLSVDKSNYLYKDKNNTFTLNSDSKNENGIIILLRYTDIKTNKVVENYDVVTENVQLTLNNKIFTDIPSNSLVSLYFIRGNVLVFTANNGARCKLLALTASSNSFTIK